jgi:hypothetical protein
MPSRMVRPLRAWDCVWLYVTNALCAFCAAQRVEVFSVEGVNLGFRVMKRDSGYNEKEQQLLCH